MKQNLIFSLISLFLACPVFSQFSTDYEPLRSEGSLPEDLTILSSEKYQMKKESIEEDLKRSERKEQSDFLLESTFNIDQLLLNGKVLFNDPLTLYVQKVLDNIISKDDSIYQKLQVYVVKSPYVNAFATDRGALFINVGLLAQLSNEAELAYILCHEIIHYREKHNMTGYIEYERIHKGKGNYRRSTESEKILEKSNYSKELESVADEEGFELFLKTDYDPELIIGVFDVLQYSYLPIDDIAFESDFMETQNYKIPANYYIEETAPIKSVDDYDDSKSSHPNVKKRRDVIFELIAKNKTSEKKGFVNPKAEFIQAQQLARLELNHLYIMDRDYAKALYNSYLMLKEYPDNKYLKTSVAYSLYALLKYGNEGKTSYVLPHFEKIQGKSQDVYHIFGKMEEDELAVFANAYIWELQKKYPEDTFLKNIAIDALQDMVLKNELDKDYFLKKYPKETEMQLEADLSEEEYEKLSKYEKIRLQKLLDEKENFDSSKLAFIELFDYPLFTEELEKYSTILHKQKNPEKKSKKEQKKELRAENKQKKILARKGRALGIDKIVIVEPNFLKLDQRKDINNRYLSSEKKQLQLSETMQMLAEKAELETVVIGNKSQLTANSIKQYNHNALVNDWIEERASHGDMEIIPFESKYTMEMAEEYDTPYFLYSGIYNIRQKQEFDYMAMAVSLLYVVPIPLYLYYQFRPYYETYFYSLLFDITTGDALMVNDNFITEKESRDLTRISYYDTFHQIKSERK